MQVSRRQYQRIAAGALVSLAIIIVTGAAVRLTNSGLGCDDWPRCNSTKLIDVSSKHAAIEQINRLFTGVVGVAMIAAVLASMIRTPRRRDLTRLSWGLVAGVVGNAVLGGISVKYDLHPMLIQGHMLLSMALIVVGTALVRRAGEPDGAVLEVTVTQPTKHLTRVLFGLTSVVVFTGTIVTGAGPHAGDENAERLNVSIPAVARLHGVTVMMTLAVALAIAWRIRSSVDDRKALTNVISMWIFVGMLQAAIGYIQYFNEVPALLVGIHVAGATAVMLVTTLVVLDTRTVETAVVSEPSR
jgi:heme a synthase